MDWRRFRHDVMMLIVFIPQYCSKVQLFPGATCTEVRQRGKPDVATSTKTDGLRNSLTGLCQRAKALLEG